jgi:hypothetical protein
MKFLIFFLKFDPFLKNFPETNLSATYQTPRLTAKLVKITSWLKLPFPSLNSKGQKIQKAKNGRRPKKTEDQKRQKAKKDRKVRF